MCQDNLFPCGYCNRLFAHTQSRNRHIRKCLAFAIRTCLLCNSDIDPNENIHEHMRDKHDLKRIFSCECCSFMFPYVHDLQVHRNSMLKDGTIGDVVPVARTNNPPGWLLDKKTLAESRQNLNEPTGDIEEDASRLLHLVKQRLSADVQPSMNLRSGSLSPTTTSSTTSENLVMSPSPTVVQFAKRFMKQAHEECVRLQNEEVSKILASGKYAGADFGRLEIWKTVVKEAEEKIIERLEKKIRNTGIEKI